jgi:hypothetical protein
VALKTEASPGPAGVPRHRRFRRSAAGRSLGAGGVLLTLALALAACGGGTTGPDRAASPDTPPATTGAPAPAAAPAQAGSPAVTTPPTSAPSGEPRTTARPRPAAATRPRTQTQAGTTTQSQPAPAPTSAPEEPAGTPIDELAVLTLVERRGRTHYFQAGTVTGTYDGTMQAEARVVAAGVRVHFTATVEGGTIVGTALAIPVIAGSPTAKLDGTATITGGTGKFASIRGRGLRVSGKARLDASRSRMRLTGTVTF